MRKLWAEQPAWAWEFPASALRVDLGGSENTKRTGFRPGFPSKSHSYLLQMFPKYPLHFGRLWVEEGWELTSRLTWGDRRGALRNLQRQTGRLVLWKSGFPGSCPPTHHTAVRRVLLPSPRLPSSPPPPSPALTPPPFCLHPHSSVSAPTTGTLSIPLMSLSFPLLSCCWDCC